MSFVLSGTCMAFKKAEIDFCSLLAVCGRRASIIGLCAASAYMYTFLSAVCGTGWICLLLVEIMIFSAMFSGKERI